jgi:hypothetical protein
MSSDDSTVHDWLRWLEGPDGDLRHEAKLRLGGIMPDDDVPVQPLMHAVAAAREPALFWAIVALGRLGSRASAAVSMLRETAAGHYQFGIRESALVALAKIAPDDAQSKACAVAALGDINPFVRQQALRALISFQGLTTEDLAAIKACESDPDESVSRWSEIALRNIRLAENGCKE